MSFTIEAIKESDYAEWSAVWKQYLDFYETSLPEEQYKNTFKRLITPETDKGKDLFGFLLRDDSKEVKGLAHFLFHANCWTDKPHCYLNDLFVGSECRGRGFGKELILATQKISKEKGCARLYV